MLLYENNYKGKWHVYDDEPDEMYGDNGTVESNTITDAFLLEHAAACDYYGIPMYTGKNPEFQARCDYAWKKFIALSEATECPQRRFISIKDRRYHYGRLQE